MAIPAISLLSPEEYLHLERESSCKSEYHDGGMFAMSGGTFAHSVIPGNIITALNNALGGKGCRATTPDLKIGISPAGPFVYPDATVVCGKPELADEIADVLLNPAVIFEVLSKSSEAYDRGHKFGLYRKIPSLLHYVLVSQTEHKIEVFSRDGEGRWVFSEAIRAGAVCALAGIGCELALSQVFAGLLGE